MGQEAFLFIQVRIHKIMFQSIVRKSILKMFLATPLYRSGNFCLTTLDWTEISQQLYLFLTQIRTQMQIKNALTF